MAAAERIGAAAAARLRRDGTGAFVGPVGAFSDHDGRSQHSGGCAQHAGAIFPRAAPPDRASLAQAAGGDDAQEPVAAPASGLDAGRMCLRPLPARDCRRQPSAAERGRRAALRRQDLLRTGKRTPRPQSPGRGHRADGADLSAADGRARRALAPYKDGTPVYWVQEEPENMGAWRFLLARFRDELFDRLPFAGIYRRASSSPATGSASSHKLEQKELLMQAFGCI